MNRAEEWVGRICTTSFFALWSYANPKGRNGKELCDTLVVCDPDVLIFSVKDIEHRETDEVKVGWERWERRAIRESIKQIFGAERWLTESPTVIRSDGTAGITLPEISSRRVFRIAVALGGEGKVPIASGDTGRGYVHVFTEKALETVMGELDTIEDFVQYLKAVEGFDGMLVIEGTEADLLAHYLSSNRSLPKDVDILQVTGGSWDSLAQSSEYRARKEAESVSRLWDQLLEELSGDVLGAGTESETSLDDSELAIRAMARETRFARRSLSEAFLDYLSVGQEKKIGARLLTSPSGIAYVFLAEDPGRSRQGRKEELALRCFVARGLLQTQPTVVGLATEFPGDRPGHSLDICYLHMPEWTQENQNAMDRIQADLEFFLDPRWSKQSVEEYPRKADPDGEEARN